MQLEKKKIKKQNFFGLAIVAAPKAATGGRAEEAGAKA